ncbi:MAG: hypothetical protein HPY66_3359 [Firmicutes bacterium]|nr:hypothetical protein [Bacillota bacterium]MDI6706795.1 GntR family transcriptional regulator [Bacillota bacterium]
MKFKTLKDHIYEYISSRITDGSLKANEKINEKEICDDLDVSPTPVKEVLIQLETDGYLKRIPRRGFYVKELTLEKVREKYIIIGALDGLAASLSLPHIIKKDIEQMKYITEMIDIAIKAKKYNQYFQLQTEFHNVYLEKCGNEELIILLDRLKKSFIKQTYYIQEREERLFDILQETNNEHKKIISLFEIKDKTRLEDYIRNIHWSVKHAGLDAFQSKDNSIES